MLPHRLITNVTYLERIMSRLHWKSSVFIRETDYSQKSLVLWTITSE